MKIAMCVPLELSQAGGVERHVVQLAKALDRLGVSIDVYGKSDNGLCRDIRGIQPGRYDVIHTHGCAFTGRFISMVLNRRARQRHIHTLHGVSLDYLRACGSWFNWRCYWASFIEGVYSRYADHVIAVSRSVKQRCEKVFRVAPEKTSVIYNGFKPFSVSPERRRHRRRDLGLRQDELVLLFVGRGQDQVKGSGAVAWAMNKLYHNYRNLRLLAVPGEGFPEAQWLCRGGKTAYDDMPDYYAVADIFVNASLNEGMPLTVIEAMAAGLPVIAAQVGGIPEIIKDEDNGLLLRPDRSDLCRQLRRLIEDEPLRKKLGQHGRQSIENLSWKNLAQQTVTVYETALGKASVKKCRVMAQKNLPVY